MFIHNILLCFAGNSKRSKVIVAVSVLLAATVVVITIILYFLWKWRAQPKGKIQSDRYIKSRTGKKVAKKEKSISYGFKDKSEVVIHDLQVLKLKDLILATDDFSNNNMLGRGGFGEVYKVL